MRKGRDIFLTALTLFAVILSMAEAEAANIERRRPQYATEPAHLLIPAPYSLDGIGEGIAIFGLAYNVADTYTDIFGTIITGDLEGYGAGFTEFHIFEKRLFMDFTLQKLNNAMIQSYRGRGMDTPSDDYLMVGLSDMTFTGAKLTLTFRERMFEVYAMGYDGSYRVDTLKEPDGTLLADTMDGSKSNFNLYGVGMVIDLTDDRNDPRAGVRLDSNIAWSPNRSDFEADYKVIDHSLTAYIPIGGRSTWAFNYFQSDVSMGSQGETDPVAVYNELGFDCHLLADPVEQADCQSAADEYVANVVAANHYGSASSLGGRSRLRSYPEDRFRGAHTAFVGTEFRWNITEEVSPFDIKLVKDIRTGIQVAFFYELGTVAETPGELWDRKRDSIGAGLRIVNASGSIYRVDYAVGGEGDSFTLIINYPWEAF